MLLGAANLEAHHDLWRIATRIENHVNCPLRGNLRPPTLVRARKDAEIDEAISLRRASIDYAQVNRIGFRAASQEAERDKAQCPACSPRQYAARLQVSFLPGAR